MANLEDKTNSNKKLDKIIGFAEGVFYLPSTIGMELAGESAFIDRVSPERVNGRISGTYFAMALTPFAMGATALFIADLIQRYNN